MCLGRRARMVLWGHWIKPCWFGDQQLLQGWLGLPGQGMWWNHRCSLVDGISYHIFHVWSSHKWHDYCYTFVCTQSMTLGLMFWSLWFGGGFLSFSYFSCIDTRGYRFTYCFGHPSNILLHLTGLFVRQFLMLSIVFNSVLVQSFWSWQFMSIWKYVNTHGFYVFSVTVNHLCPRVVSMSTSPTQSAPCQLLSLARCAPCYMQLFYCAHHFSKELAMKLRAIVIVDDMEAIYAHLVSTWFTHHYETFITHLVQNVFDKDPSHSTIGLDTTYIVLFKNHRDMSGVSHSNKQVSLSGNGILTATYLDATVMCTLSYVVIDFN